MKHPFPGIARMPRTPENAKFHNELAEYLMSLLVTKRMPTDKYGNKYGPKALKD